MPHLYIIAGCNGAGKTTAGFTLFNEMLNCREFVNADVMTADISPLNPANAAFKAGKMMLERVHQLMRKKADFAFETTLATRSLVSLIKTAKVAGYTVTLCCLWLRSAELAKHRVQQRALEGGQDIPSGLIERGYARSASNLVNIYIPVCDNWLVIDNTDTLPELIAYGAGNNRRWIRDFAVWSKISPDSNASHQLPEDNSHLSGKIMQGMKIATRKLVENSASHDKKLVIGDKIGNIIKVPAKNLLTTA